MFHFSTRNALLPSAAMTILLGLRACGGGGGSDAPADTTTTTTASGAAAGAAAGTVTTTTTPPPTTPPPAAGPLSITGLTDYRSTAPNTLVNFAAATPNTVVSKAITGLNRAGFADEDIVVGIDVRPSNGVMNAFARAKDTNGDPLGAASIYVVNPDTGAASGRVAVTGVVFDGATSVSVDFNPVADLLRVITFFGQSVAINVTNGAATQNGAIQGTTFAAAVAYTNSAVSTTAPASTVLYRIDNQGAPDDLTTVTPATGAVAAVGSIGIDLNEVQAFDITGATNENALAALRTTATGAHSLYRINLTTGAATLFNATAALSLIGGAAGVPLVDIAIRP